MVIGLPHLEAEEFKVGSAVEKSAISRWDLWADRTNKFPKCGMFFVAK
jgi:hypothetical protein